MENNDFNITDLDLGELSFESDSSLKDENNDTVDTALFSGEPETIDTLDNEIQSIVNAPENKDGGDNSKKEEIPEGIDTTEFENKGSEDTTDSKEHSSPSSSPSGNANVYATLASALAQDGVFSEPIFDKFKDKVEKGEVTADVFRDMFDEQLRAARYEDLNDAQKEYLTALDNGIPFESIVQANNTRVQYDSITEDSIESEDSEELRIQLIANDLISDGLNQEKAMKMAKMSVETGDDIEEAKKALSSLKEKSAKALREQSKAQEEQLRAEAEKRENYQKKLQDKVTSTEEYFKGFPVDERIRKTVFKNMTTPVGKDDSGNPISIITAERNKDPEAFEMKLHYLFHITDGFKNLDYLNRVGKKNSLKDLEEKINVTDLKLGQSRGGAPDSPSTQTSEILKALDGLGL